MLRRLGMGRRGIAYAFRRRATTVVSDSSSSPRAAIVLSGASSSLVTALFRRYDFDETDSDIILCKFPDILALDLDKNIRPKLDFLRDCGLTGTEIGDILASNPFLLNESLDDSISTSVSFLKTFFPSKQSLRSALTSQSIFLACKRNAHLGFLKKNIEFLKDRGVPESRILALFVREPNVLKQYHPLFVDAVCKVEGLGFSPASGLAFERSMKLSADTLRKMVEISQKIGCKAESLILSKRGLEKWIVPRCAVLNLLVSRGLLRRKNILWSKIMCMSSSLFFENYVQRYKSEVPDLENALRGDVEFQGLEYLKVDGGIEDSDDAEEQEQEQEDEEEEEEHPLTLLYRKISQKTTPSTLPCRRKAARKNRNTHP